jgi:flavin reductase (DIM6/NTAB) family NADH-FMN oxidoreductase RutF
MKISIDKKTLVYTHPVFVVGSYDEKDTPNMMVAAWAGVCSSEPPSINISIRKPRKTYTNILLNNSFTVNIPPVKYVKEADFTGVATGKKVNKFDATKLTAVKSELVNAPYVQEFPLNLICKLKQHIDLGVHTMFIGEVLDVLVDESACDAQGIPDIRKIDPFIFDSASRAYYSIGERLINAYTIKSLDD